MRQFLQCRQTEAGGARAEQAVSDDDDSELSVVLQDTWRGTWK